MHITKKASGENFDRVFILCICLLLQLPGANLAHGLLNTP